MQIQVWRVFAKELDFSIQNIEILVDGVFHVKYCFRSEMFNFHKFFLAEVNANTISP